MKQVELIEEELTDLRTGAEGRLLVGQGLRSNSLVVFEAAAGRQQSVSPRWSPLRWSREAEGTAEQGEYGKQREQREHWE